MEQTQLDTLTQQQRRLYFVSGVFAPDAPFTKDALITVSGDGQLADVRALVPGFLAEDDAGRLRHLDVDTHAYALEQLGDEAAAYRKAHLNYYLRRSEQWLAAPYEQDELAAEVAQYHHAFTWAREHDHNAVINLVVVGSQHLAPHKQHLPEIQTWLDGALAVIDSHNMKWGQPGAIRALGDAAVRVNHLETGRTIYYHALQRYGDTSLAGQAHTFKGLGDLSFQAGDKEGARDFYYKALVLYEVVEFKLGQANVLKQLASLNAAVKDIDSAHEYYERAITLYANMNFESQQADSLKELADLYAERGDYENARQYYESAYALYGSIEFWVEQADTLLALGHMQVRANSPGAAHESYERALPIYEKMGERRGKANALRSLGNLHLLESELARASEYFRQALDLYHQVEAYGEAAVMDQLLAHLLVDQGRKHEAVQMIARAASALDNFDDPLRVHELQVGLQHIRREIGDEFESLWEESSASTPIPNWLRADVDSTGIEIPVELIRALKSPQALRDALDENSGVLLHYLSHLPEQDRADWLERAMSYYKDAEESAVAHRHSALLLKEMASLPGRDVSATLHAAVGAFDAALELERDNDADYTRTQKERIALLRDMAGMPGENRADLLFVALEGCDAALGRLEKNPGEYAHIQLTRAHLLRELAGLRGEDRGKWMLQALSAYDEALALIQDAPLEHATAQTNRASLLQEIAMLPDQDRDARLREALTAGADALVLAAQAETPDYERVTRRMMTSIRQAIVDAYDMETFALWYFELIGVPPPPWLLE